METTKYTNHTKTGPVRDGHQKARKGTKILNHGFTLINADAGRGFTPNRRKVLTAKITQNAEKRRRNLSSLRSATESWQDRIIKTVSVWLRLATPCPRRPISGQWSEGMRFVVGGPEKLRQQVAGRTEVRRPYNLLAANQQGDYGRCSSMLLGVTLRCSE